jgi:Kef-type K+ transport system membrane component KefB
MEFQIPPLLIVLIAGVLAPLLGEYTSRFGLPVIVLEILIGIIIGPIGLGWGDPSAGIIPSLSLFGMGFLFFLAGLEVDLVAMGDKLKRALITWASILVIAYFCAIYLREHEISQSVLVITIAVTTTALGILVPILRDRGLLDTPLGQQVLALGAIGELGPILAMSLTLSTRHSAPVQTAFTLLFLAIVIFLGWMIVRAHTPRVLRLLEKTLTQSSQLPIRLAVLLLVGMAVLADGMGIDLALGGLATGMIMGFALRNSDAHVFHLKVDAVGFGFLIPIFFISSGMKLEVLSLFESIHGIILTGSFVVVILLSRLPVIALYFRELGFRNALSLGLLSATTLPFIVALTEVGVRSGLLTQNDATPLVVAGMLTVMAFPAIATLITRDPSK